jgi:hypothetical protein
VEATVVAAGVAVAVVVEGSEADNGEFGNSVNLVIA